MKPRRSNKIKATLVPLKITYGDRIRAMNDEELVEMFEPAGWRKCEICTHKNSDCYQKGVDYDCRQGILAYLKTEVE